MFNIKDITIKDIAKISGVGVSTVSRAINNHQGINPETRQRILDIMKEYNYSPNVSARNLKLTDTKTIAVLIKGISNPFFSTMIKVFEEEIQKEGYNFLLYKVDLLQDEINVAIDIIKEKKLSGIIFLGGNFIKKEDLINKINVPFVLSTVAVTSDLLCQNYSFVSVDDEEESFKIVDFLCKKGNKKIAIIKALDSDISIGYLRFAGYKKALKENGIKFDENLCFSMREDIDGYSVENGYHVMKNILEYKKNNAVDAVYAISDSVAMGACRATYEAGLSIPNDISIAGFDGIELSKYFIPKLTTVEQPINDMAIETTNILFKMIEKKGYTKQKIYKGILALGESVK